MAFTGCTPARSASSPMVRPSASGIDSLRTTTISGIGADRRRLIGLQRGPARGIGQLGQPLGHRADGRFTPCAGVVVEVPVLERERVAGVGRPTLAVDV